ncbi:MAG: hypothetical protein ACLFPL_01045 [Candidatus Nanoarchaeia archaeon]
MNKYDTLTKEVLERLFSSNINLPGFFIATERYYIQENYSGGSPNYTYIVPVSLSRGDIIDSFSKIEFFIGYLIMFKLDKNIKFDSTKYYQLRTLISKITFESKFKILEEWKLLDDIKVDEFKKIHYKLKSVRNVLAHEWYIYNAVYGRNRTIEGNFTRFQNDIKTYWKSLVEIYEKLESQEKQLLEVLDFLKINEK